MTFGEKLREARKRKGLTQRELAQIVKAAHNSISNWENDQNKPDPDTIQAICWALDVTPNYFFLDDEKQIAPDVFSLPGVMPPPKTVKKPRLGTIACGQPILAEQNIEGYDQVPANIHCDFTLMCKGDSMIGAHIKDGSVVYIRIQEDVETREIAAVLIDDDTATLKRVYKDANGNVTMLLADNPDYEPIIITPDVRVRIIGKAVGYTSYIK